MFTQNASVSLVDASTVRDNRALAGAGIYDIGGGGGEDESGSRITLGGTSAIRGNLAVSAGGSCEANDIGLPGSAGGIRMAVDSALTMTGSSVITDNAAACDAGGLMSLGELRGVTCAPAPGSNVYANRPNDCVDPDSGRE